jgi:hypothetical protein
MNIKRLLLVSLGILGVLIVLGAAGFILTSRSSAQVDEALSAPPAELSSEQSTVDYEAKYESLFAEKKSNPSGHDSYMSEGFGCSHDTAQAIDWYNED